MTVVERSPRTTLWDAVDRMIDRAGELTALQAHGLELLAARRLRNLGRPVPDALVSLEQAAALRALLVPLVLDRVRGAYDGRLVLFKGLEVGTLYPDPTLRPFGDIDLLADRPEDAQRALIATGFEPVGHSEAYYTDRHHLPPLCCPDLPLVVEIHRRPEWPGWASPPTVDELFAEAVPSGVQVDGLLALSSAAHALVIAAHSWASSPLRRTLDLIDIAVLTLELDPAQVQALAEHWGVARMWTTTRSATDALFFGSPVPWSLRLWARDLTSVRDRTVLENHLRPLLGAFWALPPYRAARFAGQRLGEAFRPSPYESWRPKFKRTVYAARNARKGLGEHHRVLVDNSVAAPEVSGRTIRTSDSAARRPS